MSEKKTMDEWVQDQTQEITIEFYGTKTTFIPEICSTIIGNGRQLIWVQNMMTRPYFWLIRIDSSTDISSDKFNIEDLFEYFEEDFGRCLDLINEDEFEQLKAEGDEECVICETYKQWLKSNWNYPCFSWDGGFYETIVNLDK